MDAISVERSSPSTLPCWYLSVYFYILLPYFCWNFTHKKKKKKWRCRIVIGRRKVELKNDGKTFKIYPLKNGGTTFQLYPIII